MRKSVCVLSLWTWCRIRSVVVVFSGGCVFWLFQIKHGVLPHKSVRAAFNYIFLRSNRLVRASSDALWIRSCIDSLEIVTARIDLCLA